jgi:hypothetical protein
MEFAERTNAKCEELTSSAKARTYFERLTARLKSCPSRNVLESEFFRKLWRRLRKRSVHGTPEQRAEKVEYRRPAPKGASDFEELWYR